MARLGRLLKRTLATTTLLGALLCAPARSQTAAPYTYVFPGLPSAGSCELDVVNTSSSSNLVRLQAYGTAGDQQADVTLALGPGGAQRANIMTLLQRMPSTVTVGAPSAVRASMTCILNDTAGHMTGYTVPPVEFLSQTTGFLVVSPALSYDTLASPSVLLAAERLRSCAYTDPLTLVTHNPLVRLRGPMPAPRETGRSGLVLSSRDEPITWKNTLVAGAMSQALTFDASTGQVDAAKTSALAHTVTSVLPAYGTFIGSIDTLFSGAVLANSTNGTITSTAGALPAYQVFHGSDGSSFPLRLASEEAARTLYFTHVFSPAPTEATVGNFTNVLGIENPSANATSVYLTPYDANGNDLGSVVLTIPAHESWSARPQDVFKDLKNYSSVQWVLATSKEPVQGFELFQYGMTPDCSPQVISVNAGTNLDLGTSIIAMRAQGGATQTTSYALLNPGNRDEPVTATARDTNGNNLGTTQLTIPAHQKRTSTLIDLFNGDMTSARYVTFTTTPPTKPGPIDMHHPTGRILGISVNIDSNDRVHMEGRNLINNDALVANIETSAYNPRTNNEIIEFGDNPQTINATIRTTQNTTINNITYDPVGLGRLNQGMSATLPTQNNGRQYNATTTTVNGPLRSQVVSSNGPDFDPIVISNIIPNYGPPTPYIALAVTPTITIDSTDANNKAQSTTLNTVLTVQDPKDYDFATLNLDALTLTKSNIPAMATLLSSNKDILNPGNNAPFGTYSVMSNAFTLMTTPGTQTALTDIIIIDRPAQPSDPTMRRSVGFFMPGGYIEADFPSTTQGTNELHQLLSIYQLGPEWYHTPTAGTVLTLPK